MAITEKDLAAAIAKLKERNAQQQKPVERMSIAEFHKMYGTPETSGVTATGAVGVGADADVVRKQSEKVLEEQENIAKSVTETDGNGLNANAERIVEGLNKTSDGITKLADITKKQSKEQSDAIAELANNIEISLSPLEKMQQYLSKTKDALSPKNLKETLLGGGAKMFKGVPLIGGMFQRAREKETWIKTQMKVDPTLTRAQLSDEYAEYKKSARDVRRTSKEYEETRKLFGMGDSAFAKTPQGKQLLEKQKAATKEFARYERRARFVAGEDEESEDRDPAVNATRKNADATASAEKEQEVQKSFDEQTELLKKIAENTSPDGAKEPTKAETGGGLSGMMRSFGKMGVGGIISTLLKGAGVLAALGGALLVASVGFKAFADLDWETLAKAGVAITGLAVAAGTIGSFAGPIAIGAAVIAGLGASVWVLGEGLQAVGESINMFIENIERLGEIDGSNLLQVGAGLAAVAGGLVAFGAANAVAGVTNLVSGFLGAVTPGKTPVEQLLEIAQAGPNIQAAGTGIQAFAEGLTKFSAVDKDKLKLIADLPSDKIVAIGEAIGKSAPASANAVYGASAENASAAVVAGGGTTNNVVAPTTVNNTTNQMGGYKPDVRNQDSSFKRMLDSRYVPV